MKKKTKIILSVVLALLVIAAAVLLVIHSKPTQPADTQTGDPAQSDKPVVVNVQPEVTDSPVQTRDKRIG